jgi:hypothetical protein
MIYFNQWLVLLTSGERVAEQRVFDHEAVVCLKKLIVLKKYSIEVFD